MNIIKKIVVSCIIICSVNSVHAQSKNLIGDNADYRREGSEKTHFPREEVKTLISEYKLWEAENLLINFTNTRQERNIDTDYVRGLHQLGKVYFLRGKYLQADSVYTKALELSRKLPSFSQLDSAEILNDLIDVRIEADMLEGLDISIEQVLNTRKEYLGEENLKYAEILNNRGRYYLARGLFDKAEEDLKQASQIRLDITGEDSEEYFNSLTTLGNLYFYKQSFQIAYDYFDQATEVSKNLANKRHSIFASLCLATLYISIGELNKAGELMLQTLPSAKMYYGEHHPDYITTLSNLGSLYVMQGQLEKGESILSEALRITYESFGEEHSQYFTTLNSLAYLYQELNKFEQAEPLLQKSIALRKKLYGETSPTVATALNHLAIFQLNIGNYKKAEATALEGLEVAKKSLDVSAATPVTLLNTLGMAYLEQDKFDLALKTFQEAEDLLMRNSSEKDPIYLTILNNIAATLHEDKTKDISESEPVLLRIINRMQADGNTTSPLYLTTLNNLASHYLANDEYLKAESLYETMLATHKSNIGENNWKYVTYSWNAALNAELLSKFDKADAYYEKCFEIMKTLTIRDFSFLSEEEREHYWFARKDMLKNFQSYAIRSNIVNPSSTIQAYNYELFSKSLLLNSSVKIQKAILSDPELTNIWDEMKRLKITQDNMDSLQMIEKELIAKSKDYQMLHKEVSTDWKDIRNYLETNEIAIEIINIPIDNDIQYYALLIRCDSDYPQIVKLCTEDVLLARMQDSENFASVYSLIWKPLESYLINIAEIYLSSTGLLNSIPFAALMHKGEYLSDKYSIHNVLSSKDIVPLKSSPDQPANRRAILFGGADFGLPTAELNQSLDRGQGFDYLPGSRQEVEEISKILSEWEWDVTTCIDKNATETRLKASSDQNSPALLHISTHGYYFPLAKESVLLESNKFYKQSDNPLMRCGLLFSGANRTWSGLEQTANTDDGILTAYEISNLNLSSTDLVVLSACETGLGDVDYSEGVYGLQRAFRLAGAKSIIVSLWKISDKETVEMMTEFYKNWAGGMNKKDAFRKAQIKLKIKYRSEPEKWAGFIMIE